MSYKPMYCEATHRLSADGCFAAYEHNGAHRGWDEEGHEVIWPNEADETPTEPLFTNAELGILSMLIEPVKQFFPDLQVKIDAARTDA